MTGDALDTLIIAAAALFAAVTGGIFYAFSSFIMRALALMDPVSGATAMRLINITVICPGFMALFLGTGLLAAVLFVGEALAWSGWVSALICFGALSYLAGCLLPTVAVSQPMNLRLGAVPQGELIDFWRRYLTSWTRWNTFRTAACLFSAASFVTALVLQ